MIRELRRLLAIAVPLWVAQAASVALPLTDALYMGRLGANVLAGGGLASTLLATSILVAGSALGGMSPRVARAHAAGDLVEIATLARHARWMAIALATPIVLLALLGEPLLLVAGQTDDVARLASSYLIPAIASVPLTLGCTVYRGLLAARGRASIVSWAWLLAIPLNLALDHALALGLGPLPAMGLAGVGIATSLVSLGVLLFLTVAATRLGLEGRSAWIGRPSPRVAKDLAALGGPIVLAVGAEAGVFALAGIAVGWLGSPALAAHRVATVVAHACFLAPLALSQAATVRVAASAGVPDEHRTARRVPLLAALGWAGFTGLGTVLGARSLAALFLGRSASLAEQPVAFSAAVSLLYVVAAFQVVDALQSVAAGILRGAGDTVAAMRWALIAYALVAPAVAVALAVGAGLGVLGVWLGLAAGLALAAAALVPFALRAPAR